MSFENPSREQIGDILASAGNIAVVGLSDKTDRTSYMVAGAMQSRGYRIIPVNPTVDGEISGRKVLSHFSRNSRASGHRQCIPSKRTLRKGRAGGS